MLKNLPRIARVLLVAALFLAPGSEASAQVAVGANGMLTSHGGQTFFGVGGRFGFVAKRGLTWDMAVEAVAEVMFPSCPADDCGVVGGQLNVVWQRAFSGMYRGYAGFGVAYQTLTVEQDGGEIFDGDDWGINFVLGNRMVTDSPFVPFLELRLTIMNESRNQGALSAGFRIPMGGEGRAR